VQKYVPTFPKKKFPITTRQLVGHLSGIRHYKTGEQEDKKPYDDVVDGLEVFAEDPLLFEPGTTWRYSSFAWNLVSAVVQGAAREPFLDYMQKAVFDPLGLKDTCADERERIIANRTRFYGWDVKRGEAANSREIDVSYKWAGGGFLSTVEDLVKYGSAYLPGSDLLEAETLEEVFTRQKLIDGTEIQNGIGWFVSQEDGGEQIYHHGGNIRGGHSILVIRPESRVVVAMASNTSYRARFGKDEAVRVGSFFVDGSQN
jgi:CubicO group peptidase (beta-lactamase class C family)